MTTFHSFDGTDGAIPVGLIQATDGNFYGATYSGGNQNPACYPFFDQRCGTAFRITPSGAFTTLHSFNGTDGANPESRLIQATDGNFYGTTSMGGAYYRGTVFKITPEGTLTTLYSFDGTDGAYPVGLIQATNGNFYGTTSGTVFKITPSGTLTTLHSFCSWNGCPDGDYPTGLVQAADGNFYGTTDAGGAIGDGTVFKITPSGTLTKLHDFHPADGVRPQELVQGTDGNFYGTTALGGANRYSCSLNSCGTIFRITPSGTLTTLHSFDGNDGEGPWGALMQATNGTFYGTTGWGGPHGSGTVFSLCVGLGWFTEELPNYGNVGATIDILGTNLTGASHVTFNGISAPFTVVSKSVIQATVPPGAGTGYVRVMLPSGRIPNNKKFRVTPQISSFTPTSGAVGTVVTITGVSLMQTWGVTFRGVHASFTVVDDGTVTATVPTGATTGGIRITGPGGAVTTTTNFTVD